MQNTVDICKRSANCGSSVHCLTTLKGFPGIHAPTLLFFNNAYAICCTKTTLPHSSCSTTQSRSSTRLGRPTGGRHKETTSTAECPKSFTTRNLFVVWRSGQLTRGTDQSLRDCPSVYSEFTTRRSVYSLLFSLFPARILSSLSNFHSCPRSQIRLLYLSTIKSTSPIPQLVDHGYH